MEEKGAARFGRCELLALDGDAGAREGAGTSVDGLASLRHWPLALHSRAERSEKEAGESAGRGARGRKRGSGE